MSRLINMIGRRIGRLVVIERAGHVFIGNQWQVGWLCQCDCGNQKVVHANALQTYRVRSCGCKRRGEKL